MIPLIIRSLIPLIVFFVVIATLGAGLSYFLHPWARDYRGHGALVGYWRGEMVVEPGDTRQVALRLKKFRTFREILLEGGMAACGVTRPRISGSRRRCAGPRAVRATTVAAMWRIARAPGSRSVLRRQAPCQAST
ncbi:MAG: hypothetical protein ACRD2X_22835 [Vicinamibacteraceae bacterium]